MGFAGFVRSEEDVVPPLTAGVGPPVLEAGAAAPGLAGAGRAATSPTARERMVKRVLDCMVWVLKCGGGIVVRGFLYSVSDRADVSLSEYGRGWERRSNVLRCLGLGWQRQSCSLLYRLGKKGPSLARTYCTMETSTNSDGHGIRSNFGQPPRAKLPAQ